MTKNLVKKKWHIEGFNNDNTVALSESELLPNHTVVIANCSKSLVTISNKCTQITVDNCTDIGVKFKNSNSCEITNCTGLQIQGETPLTQVENSRKITVFVQKSDLSTSIIRTSMSTEVRTLTPDPDDEFANPIHDYSVPVVLATKFVNGQWVTETVKS